MYPTQRQIDSVKKEWQQLISLAYRNSKLGLPKELYVERIIREIKEHIKINNNNPHIPVTFCINNSSSTMTSAEVVITALENYVLEIVESK